MSVTEIELINIAEAYALEEQHAKHLKNMHRTVNVKVPSTIMEISRKIADVLI